MVKAYKKELSPYKVINEYTDKVEKYSHEVTELLLSSVVNVLGLKMSKAHRDAPLIFRGKIQYNPGTGKPIKKKEWVKLESAIIKFLKIEKNELQKKMVKDSFWLGTLIEKMDKTQRKKIPLKKLPMDKIDFKEISFKDYENNIIEAAEQSAGIYLQNVTDKARAKVQQVIVEGAKQKKSSHKVFIDLWDQEEDINRDWERVVRTEIATCTNNGLMVSMLEANDEEHMFVRGISSPGACVYCERLLSNKIFVLLGEAPSGGDKVKIEGKEYTAIWPGKSNIGRSVRNYWACFPLHPHGRCSFTEWFPELEEYFEKE